MSAKGTLPPIKIVKCRECDNTTSVQVLRKVGHLCNKCWKKQKTAKVRAYQRKRMGMAEPITVRAKMMCSVVHKQMYGEEVEFSCQYDPMLPEDKRFSEATPSGSMRIMITTTSLLGYYQPGQCYYLDMTPVRAE